MFNVIESVCYDSLSPIRAVHDRWPAVKRDNCFRSGEFCAASSADPVYACLVICPMNLFASSIADIDPGPVSNSIDIASETRDTDFGGLSAKDGSCLQQDRCNVFKL